MTELIGEGGMGAVSTNLAAAVEEYGGQVRLNAPVARILAEGDLAVGVVLETVGMVVAAAKW